MTETTFEANQNNGVNFTSPSADSDPGNNRENNETTIAEDEVQTNDNDMHAPTRTTHTSGENFTVPAAAVGQSPSGIRCRFLPHGFYAVIPALFSTFAWFSSLTQDGCDYARLTGPVVADLTNDPNVPFLDVGFNQYRSPTQDPKDGMWYVDYRLPCEDYNTDIVNMDGFWTFSKIAAFLSLVFGGGGALFLWFSSCFIFSRGTWRWAGYELLVATIFQAFSFLWFKTGLCHGNDGKDGCSLYYGAKADILASCFWFVSALVIFCRYPKPNKDVRSNSQGGRSPLPTELEMMEQSESEPGWELPLEGQVRPPAATSTVTAADQEII